MASKNSGFRNNEKGIALIITLLVTAVIVAVITEIVSAVHINTASTSLFKDSQEASLLSEGGIEIATAFLKEIAGGGDYTSFSEEYTKRVFKEGGKTLTLTVEDEQGKVNVNSIVFKNGRTNREYYDIYSRLLDNLGLDAYLSDTMADWIDIDDIPRPGGGESADYYMRLPRPFRTKNGAIDSIGEILLIKGYSLKTYRHIAPYITPYTDGRININTASRDVLISLSNEITGEMAERVVDYRKKQPFSAVSDIRRVQGFENIRLELLKELTVKSDTFRIFSRAKVGDAIREVEAVVKLGRPDRILYWRQR